MCHPIIGAEASELVNLHKRYLTLPPSCIFSTHIKTKPYRLFKNAKLCHLWNIVRNSLTWSLLSSFKITRALYIILQTLVIFPHYSIKYFTNLRELLIQKIIYLLKKSKLVLCFFFLTNKYIKFYPDFCLPLQKIIELLRLKKTTSII